LGSAAYLICALLLVLGILGLIVSYQANANYIDQVGSAAKSVVAASPIVASAALPPDLLLPRLDGLRAVSDTANQYNGNTPWRMRMGLYRGGALGEAAHDAYLRELNGVLLPVLASQLATQIRTSVATPDRLYEYLKGYLMLGDSGHRDPEQLRFLADVELRRLYPRDEAARQRLDAHFGQLLATRDTVSSISPSSELVEEARHALRTASLPVLMYSRLELEYATDSKRALRLDIASGPGSDQVLMRASGAPLSEPVPALYTRKVFQEINATGKYTVMQQFAADSWVFGGNLLDLRNSGTLMYQMLSLYEQDYIRVWDAVLQDVKLRPAADGRALTELLGVLSSPASPLKGYLVAVSTNTDLLQPAADPSAAGANPVQAASAALASKAAQLANVLGAPPPGADEPGTAVAKHFEPIRTLTQGPPGAAPIDAVLASLAQAHKQLQSMGGGLGSVSALDALSKSGQGEALQGLQQQAKLLPAPVGAMVAQIGTRSASLTVGQARDELSRRYEEQVARECRELIEGRYPLVRSSANDVPLADFGHVFGFGGVFDTFFRDNLAPLVDVSRAPWRWKEGAATIGGSAALLRQFEQAQHIRDIYFKAGTQVPEARFNLTPDTLDPAATRFSLDLDGQGFEYRHGPIQSKTMTWPGGGVGQAVVVFEERTGPGSNFVRQGPWALFRALDQAQLKRDSDTREEVTFSAGAHSMRVLLDATSIRNPFVRDTLSGFRCGIQP